MKRKDWIISISVSLILSVAALSSGLAEQFLSQPKPAIAATEDGIVDLMLKGYTTWNSFSGEALTVWQVNGEKQIWTATIGIQQPFQVRLDLLQDNTIKETWISNDQSIIYVDPLRGEYAETKLPNFVKDFSLIPDQDSKITPDTVIHHPMALLIPSVVGKYLFPAGLAQRSGEYQVSGTEQILDRPTYILDWHDEDESGTVTTKSRYWVDTQTGTILKAIVYGGENLDEIFEETTFTRIAFDPPIASEEFLFTPQPNLVKTDLKEIYHHDH